MSIDPGQLPDEGFGNGVVLLIARSAASSQLLLPLLDLRRT